MRQNERRGHYWDGFGYRTMIGLNKKRRKQNCHTPICFRQCDGERGHNGTKSHDLCTFILCYIIIVICLFLKKLSSKARKTHQTETLLREKQALLITMSAQ